jgi:disulfide bond formation protein DsbB
MPALGVRLNFLALLAMLAVIAAIQTAALYMQFVRGELPCPLCLLQRLALFGVAAGIVFSFRRGFSYRNTGICLVFALLLLVVAERQTLLDIYPRPGHAFVGSAILGLHMPVWSIVIALALLVGIALKLAILGGDDALQRSQVRHLPPIARTADVVGGYLVLLCLVNLVSVVVQCGFGECHTTGYRLLSGAR